MPQLSTSAVDADTPMGNTAGDTPSPPTPTPASSSSASTTTTTTTTEWEMTNASPDVDDEADSTAPSPSASSSALAAVAAAADAITPLSSTTPASTSAAAAAAAATANTTTPQQPLAISPVTAAVINNNNNNNNNATQIISIIPTKRHRVRSRSLPNLVFYDAASKIHKPMKRHEFLNPKYLSTSSLPSTSCSKASASSSQQDISPLQQASSTASSTSTAASSAIITTTTTQPPAKRHRKHKRTSSSVTAAAHGSFPPSSSCPNAPSQIQAPPVNAHSLREIDLQEIFKNPQLRHDIIFDPQLQFRPNLDGERGKRKRMIAERYWDSIVNEFQEFAEASQVTNLANLSSASRLPLLFTTLRDILLSLLPVKDRSYVDSILDPELLIQQIQHCALDFLSLAKWLAGVFKAHCAPMRDSWVDQMVSRIELGIQTKSPRRLVEGLRMVFAILEAMKLDVANHQIRSLRPMLVDTAIEFEQDYYTQIIEKGKTNLNDSLDWYKNGIQKFKDSGLVEGSDSNRSAFILTLLKLFSCASEDLVTEFPSTFGFDFSRLAGFRSELRKVVCLHLCVCLYQQMVNAEAGQMTSKSDARTIVSETLSGDKIEKLKQDLLAIIEDNVGNSKWTKNTHVLALEIAKRVEVAFGKNNAIPSQSLVNVCSGWLSKHVQPRSDLYKMLESKTIVHLYQALNKSVSVLSSLDSTVTCSTAITQPIASPVSKEIIALADRILVLVRFHWGVFGKFYVAYISDSHTHVGSSVVQVPPSSALAPQLRDVKREVTQMRQSSTSSTC